MPTYVQGIDFISDTDAVKRQAKNILTESPPNDFTDAIVQSFQYQAYSLIRTKTNKDDWDANDREFGAIQRIEVDLADAYIRKHFKQDYASETTANSTIAECLAELQQIVDNMDTETGAEEFLIARTDYKSWNINPDVGVPRGNLSIN
jgi:hypothetical protein